MPASALLFLGLTLGPTGFYQFCLDQPAQCRASSGQEATIALASNINLRINSVMKPRRETGGTDVWKTGGPTGDCEDFALTKREELIKAGVSSSAARVATGSISSGERHAVLVVTTEAGEFVMDNLTNQLLPVGRALFTVETIQSEKDPRVWVKVNLRG